MSLETAEEFHARVAAATDDEGRLAVAIEAMPGWDIYPLRARRAADQAARAARRESSPPRARRGPGRLRVPAAGGRPSGPPRYVWSQRALGARRRRHEAAGHADPASPRAHHDLADLPDDLASEMGLLMVAVTAAVESLPSVGRCRVGRYGDGGAHLHPFFFGRPARMSQLRGSPLLDWEENLPAVPEDVRRANAAHVGHRLLERFGGQRPRLGLSPSDGGGTSHAGAGRRRNLPPPSGTYRPGWRHIARRGRSQTQSAATIGDVPPRVAAHRTPGPVADAICRHHRGRTAQGGGTSHAGACRRRNLPPPSGTYRPGWRHVPRRGLSQTQSAATIGDVRQVS